MPSICRTTTPRRSARWTASSSCIPSNPNIAYAYYLRALCYYEQIADIQRDQKGTQVAMAALQDVVNRFPDSAYGRDARLKIDLCRDHLAGKEMEIGRWYEGQKLYAAAIEPLPARGRRLPDHQPRAGGAAPADRDLPDARHDRPGHARPPPCSGHNYPGSRWYEDSYRQLVAQRHGRRRCANQTADSGGFFSRTLGSIF